VELLPVRRGQKKGAATPGLGMHPAIPTDGGGGGFKKRTMEGRSRETWGKKKKKKNKKHRQKNRLCDQLLKMNGYETGSSLRDLWGKPAISEQE